MTKVKIDVTVKSNARDKFSKKENILDVLIDTPNIDTKKLQIDDQIFTVVSRPVVNQVEERYNGVLIPKTGVTDLKIFGVESEEVESISKLKVGEREFRRVNGSIDLPVDGRVDRTTLESAYFVDETLANSYAVAANEIEAEKAASIKNEAEKAIALFDKINKVLGE